jgi:hypothetical protein
LILFKILKLFGLDVPGRIEALKTALAVRAEEAADRAGEIAQEAAVIAAFGAVASFTAALAVIVGLFALYRWAAETYGPYAGLGVVGGILVVVTAVLAAVAASRSKSMARLIPPRHTMRHTMAASAAATHAAAEEAAYAAAAHEAALRASVAGESASHTAAFHTAAYVAPEPPVSAGDLIEPLAFFLARYLRFPSLANPVAEELIGNLRTVASGATEETIGRAAGVIRHGDRTNMIVVLSGAAFVG